MRVARTMARLTALVMLPVPGVGAARGGSGGSGTHVDRIFQVIRAGTGLSNGHGAVSGPRTTGKRIAMGAQRTDDLTGWWALSRVSGPLPALGLMHQRITGGRGATRIGSIVGIPFRVRTGAQGICGPAQLRARPAAAPAGRRWDGEATVLGMTIGRFRMTRDEGGAPRRN